MHTMCKIDKGIVIPNFAALRAAVFPLFAKNLRGGADIRPPPSVRGLITIQSKLLYYFLVIIYKQIYKLTFDLLAFYWQKKLSSIGST